jgi:hypothetical protein
MAGPGLAADIDIEFGLICFCVRVLFRNDWEMVDVVSSRWVKRMDTKVIREMSHINQRKRKKQFLKFTRHIDFEHLSSKQTKTISSQDSTTHNTTQHNPSSDNMTLTCRWYSQMDGSHERHCLGRCASIEIKLNR